MEELQNFFSFFLDQNCTTLPCVGGSFIFEEISGGISALL